jgi:hypothetical protein
MSLTPSDSSKQVSTLLLYPFSSMSDALTLTMCLSCGPPRYNAYQYLFSSDSFPPYRFQPNMLKSNLGAFARFRTRKPVPSSLR